MFAIPSIPALVKIIIVFFIVLFAIRQKLSLGNSFLVGALSVGLLFGLKAPEILHSLVSSILNPKTLSLAAIVSLILVLSNSMEQTGQMKRLLDSFQGLIKNPAANLAVFPALIGLLPMPGGAVFSAPMVKELGNNFDLKAELLGFINYWYRHIWEYWWPLYPGVLLTAAIADLNLWFYCSLMMPFSLLALGFGSSNLRQLEKIRIRREGKPAITPFLRELSPILIVIIIGLGLGLIIPLLLHHSPLTHEIGFIIALCLSIGWTWQANHIDKDKIRDIITDPHLIGMIYMVMSIIAFKGMLEDGHAVETMSLELRVLNIPVFLVVAALPFTIGLIAGITIAFVGTTFPLLILIIRDSGGAPCLPTYIMLAMASGFMGVLLSPLHLCLVLTNQYFICSLGSAYRHLWKPCFYLFGSAFVYFSLLYAFCR